MRRPLRVVVISMIAAFPLVLVAAADLLLVPVAEAELEGRARAAVKAVSVEARIGAFPVVARAVALGEVASVDLAWFGAEVGTVVAASFRLHVEGLGFDRSDLAGGDLTIEGVESGEIRMLIDAAELTRLFGHEVYLEGRRARARLTPQAVVDVEISATNRGLVLTAAGVAPVSAALDPDHIPCAPTAQVESGSLVLRCSFRGLPPILRERAESRTDS